MYKEKQHFTGLIFSHPKLTSISESLSCFLGSSYEIKKDVSLVPSSITHLHYFSSTRYHRALDTQELVSNQKRPHTRRIDGKTHYLYDCYLTKFELNSSICFFFSTPFKDLLRDIIDAKAIKLQSEQLTFYFVDLSRFCSLFESSESSTEITVSRINLQAVGSSGVKSIALYGDDVLRTEPYKKVKALARPSSVRMIFNNGDETFALNTDRAGNWSYYLKKQTELNAIFPIITYFTKMNLLKTTFNDPRKRVSPQDELLGVEST